MPGWGVRLITYLPALNRQVDLNKFIYSLGIRHVGERNAKLLTKEFGKNFLKAMTKLAKGDQDIYRKLNDINGIGEKILIDIINFFNGEENINTITKLMEILNIKEYQHLAAPTTLTGKTIVFTGALDHLSRAEAKAQATKLGAHVTNTVSATTDLVVAGAKRGSKLTKTKATELGIKIISEEEWLQQLT